jgi:hypothetical protein
MIALEKETDMAVLWVLSASARVFPAKPRNGRLSEAEDMTVL